MWGRDARGRACGQGHAQHAPVACRHTCIGIHARPRADMHMPREADTHVCLDVDMGVGVDMGVDIHVRMSAGMDMDMAYA